MTRGVTLKLVTILVPLMLLFVAAMILGFYNVFVLRGEARVINYAGQVRYRSYQLQMLVNEYPALQEGARHEAILRLVREFEEVLYGLRDGSKSLGLKGFRPPSRMEMERGTFRYDDPWWQFDRHIKDYNERIKPLILSILGARTNEEAEGALKIYNKNVPIFVNDVDRTVQLLESLSEKKILRYKNVESVLLGLFLGVVGGAFFLAMVYIRRPLIDIFRGTQAFAHGDFDYRVPVRGRDEMANLARGFNTMAETIKNNIETIRRKSEEVQASHALLDNVLSNMGCLVRVINPGNHRVIWQNRPLQALNPKGLERPCYVLWGKESECELCVSRKAIEESRHYSKETETPEGIVYEVHAFPLVEPEGKTTYAIEVVRDITARRKVERDLEESRIQLMQSQKMASIGHLASGIAHSLNNPLSGINMYIDVILKRMEEIKDVPVYVDLRGHLLDVKEATRRCNAVVRDLLSISRIPKPDKLPVYMNETLERVLSVVIPQIKLFKIQLVKEFSPTAPRVLGSSGQLETVFMNIISNAVDAMPEGGKLTVKTSHLASEGKVEVTISDTGCGISKKDLPYIFNPYFTTKAPGKGTGLGLSIAQLTIQSHRGTIEVDSEVGRGTIFKIKLPVYRETFPTKL